MVVQGTGARVIAIERGLAADDDHPREATAAVRVAPDDILRLAIGLVSLAVEATVQLVREAAAQTAETSLSDTEPAGPVADTTTTAVAFVGAGVGLVFSIGRSLAQLVTVPAASVGLDAAWRREVDRSRTLAAAFLDATVPALADAIAPRVDVVAIAERVDMERLAEAISIDPFVERIDLDALVRRIDVDAIVARVDIDAVAAGIDIEAIVRRLDLAALAQQVIDELDLPAIIRSSTESMAAETRDGVRAQSMQADGLVARLVDRALMRGGANEPTGAVEPGEGPR